MSFPANAIGLGLAGYAGYKSCSLQSTTDWVVLIIVALLAAFFGLILS